MCCVLSLAAVWEVCWMLLKCLKKNFSTEESTFITALLKKWIIYTYLFNSLGYIALHIDNSLSILTSWIFFKVCLNAVLISLDSSMSLNIPSSLLVKPAPHSACVVIIFVTWTFLKDHHITLFLPFSIDNFHISTERREYNN